VLPSNSTPSPDTCADTNDGAVDTYGDGCAAYNGNEGWCAGYDVSSPGQLFDSCSMCCACSGSNRCPEPATDPSPGPDTNDSGADTNDSGADTNDSGADTTDEGSETIVIPDSSTLSTEEVEIDDFITSKNLSSPTPGCGLGWSSTSNGSRTLKVFVGGCSAYERDMTVDFVLSEADWELVTVSSNAQGFEETTENNGDKKRRFTLGANPALWNFGFHLPAAVSNLSYSAYDVEW